MESQSDNNRSPQRGPGRNRARLLGDLLLIAGVVSLFLAGFAYYTDPSRAEMSLPKPVALTSATDEPTASPTAALPTATPMPTSPAATATPTVVPTPSPTPIPAGTPTRIVIPRIAVDSKVSEMGTTWKDGQLIWETIPFIVGHYRETAMAGQKGNAVFAGHVTSQTLGNVFINLYKVQLGDEVKVYTKDALFTYKVSKVREVLPTDTSVFNSTADATATLITCAGDWIPSEHQYSRRLIVSAKLESATLLKPAS